MELTEVALIKQNSDINNPAKERSSSKLKPYLPSEDQIKIATELKDQMGLIEEIQYYELFYE